MIAGGSLSVTMAGYRMLHPFASVMVREYVPAGNPVGSSSVDTVTPAIGPVEKKESGSAAYIDGNGTTGITVAEDIGL